MARWRYAVGLGLLFCPVTGAIAQSLGGGGAPEISFMRVFLSLFVCLIVAGLVLLFLRAKMRGGARLPLLTRLGTSEQELQLIETRRVAPQTDLCLISCRGIDYLVLIAPGGTTVLDKQSVAEQSDPQ